jgi:hypothetical protein
MKTTDSEYSSGIMNLEKHFQKNIMEHSIIFEAMKFYQKSSDLGESGKNSNDRISL